MTTRLDKPTRRLVDVAGVPYVIEISRAGVMFRRPGRRVRIVAPWRAVLQLAERLAGDELYRELLRKKALRRIAR
jgi:hypothetical protein